MSTTTELITKVTVFQDLVVIHKYLSVSVFGYVYVNAGALRGQWDPLEWS